MLNLSNKIYNIQISHTKRMTYFFNFFLMTMMY